MKRLLLLLAVVGVLAGPGTVLARDIPRLPSQITDETGELSGSTSRVQAALETLQNQHDVQLWVLFIETTDNLSITEFATEVADRNSLGVNDALLVVALTDRTDAVWVADGMPQITNSEIDSVIADRVEPRLADGDFDGAVIAAAEGLGEAADGTPAATAAPTATAVPGGTQGGGQSSGGGISILPVILVVVAMVVVYAVVVRVMRARQGRASAEERDRQTGDLAKEANRLLIETDDAIRSARQELGFAEAQFSEADIMPFRAALDAAATELRAAFTVRQQLDDAVPEDPPTRARMLGEIVERCKRGRTLVDEQLARLQSLRDLERTAPDILAQLPDRIVAVEARFRIRGDARPAANGIRGLELEGCRWEPGRGRQAAGVRDGGGRARQGVDRLGGRNRRRERCPRRPGRGGAGRGAPRRGRPPGCLARRRGASSARGARGRGAGSGHGPRRARGREGGPADGRPAR